jgi:ATP-dependent DNA helicase RecG
LYQEKEGKNLELKEELTDTFLKSVSAYANFCDGKIIFGIANNGEIRGIINTEEFRLQVENKINDSISPRPNFRLDTEIHEAKEIIVLTVRKGKNTPYWYKNKAYKRSDTSSTQVDNEELRYLMIEGSGNSYDQIPSQEVNLQFDTLQKMMKDELNLENFNDDTLITLGLISDGRYTLAAQLLADKNHNLQSSTTIIRFGSNESVFLDRSDLAHQSLLLQYSSALDMFDKWYKPYEQVVGFTRVNRIHIPREAYREAVANALIHRRFDINASVQIAMYENKIVITSPGGLPDGMSETSYLYGQVSLLRNINIAEIFYRLRIIDKFGTGVNRMRTEYEPYGTTPQFDVSSQQIIVVLPTIRYNETAEKTNIEDKILLLLSQRGIMSRAEIEDATGYKKSRLQEVLKTLLGKDRITKVGTGPAVKYQIK